MPLSEDLTIYLRIWTGQKCGACGAEFHYLRRFEVQRHHMEFNATSASVEAQYVKHCREFPEQFPCPQCGWVQPDMTGYRKWARHGRAAFAGFLVLLLNFIAGGIGILTLDMSCLIAVGVVSMALLFHLSQMRSNPNRCRDANRAVATKREEEGMLKLIKPGKADPAAPAFPMPKKDYVNATAILIASGLLFNLPSLIGLSPWLGHIGGIILFLWSGSAFANAALKMMLLANPREIVSVEAIPVLDDTVPEDFQKK